MIVQEGQTGRYPNFLYPAKEHPEELTLPGDRDINKRDGMTTSLQKSPTEQVYRYDYRQVVAFPQPEDRVVN